MAAKAEGALCTTKIRFVIYPVVISRISIHPPERVFIINDNCCQRAHHVHTSCHSPYFLHSFPSTDLPFHISSPYLLLASARYPPAATPPTQTQLRSLCCRSRLSDIGGKNSKTRKMVTNMPLKKLEILRMSKKWCLVLY